MDETSKPAAAAGADHVIRAIAASKDPARQVQILGDHLRETAVLPLASFFKLVADRASADLVHAKTFLLLLDPQVRTALLGRERLAALAKTLQADGQFKSLETLFERTAALEKDRLDLVKAKVAFVLQLLYLLRERSEEDGIPQTSYDAARAVGEAIDGLAAPDARQVLRVDLSRFGSAYRHVLVELLKEADFRSASADAYELVLSEAMIRQYASGSALVSAEAGDKKSRRSDAVVARIGENLVKRLSLLARTVSMYPADHPGIGPMLEALTGLVDDLTVEKEQVTLSRIGLDVLLEEVKIKKKTKALTDFAAEMEERHLNSITFRRHLTADELKTFVDLLALNPQQLQKKGGVKRVLEDKGIVHVGVDQFKYGIIADDGTVAVAATDARAAEAAILTEVVARLKDGQGIGDVSAEDLGNALKQVLAGRLAGDKGLRKSLAQMILMLDPELMERAIFDKGLVRDELSWSAARSMVDQLLGEIERGDPDRRQAAIADLGQLAEVAVARHKETTLSLILDRLADRLWTRERDLDVNQKAFEVLTNLARRLVLTGKFAQAHSVARLLARFVEYNRNLPPDRRDLFARAMAEMAQTALAGIPQDAVVGALVRELTGHDSAELEVVGELVRYLAGPAVVEGLLTLFQESSRTVRNRAFSLLSNLGPATLTLCAERLRHLNDGEAYPRMVTGALVDAAWYTVRNCIDLVAKLGAADHVLLLRGVADDGDARVRRGALGALAKLDPKEAVFLARKRLGDPDPGVIETAIQLLGSLQARDHADDLIEVLYVDARYRAAVVQALAKIGGEPAESILLAALRFRGKTAAARIFAEDLALRLAAVKALGTVGGARSEAELAAFLAAGRNPLRRLWRFPVGSVTRGQELFDAAVEAGNRIRYRLRERPAAPAAPPGPAR